MVSQTFPQLQKIEIKQHPTAADPTHIDALDGLIILLPAAYRQKPWPDFPYAERLRQRLPHTKSRGPLPAIHAELPNGRGTFVSLAFIEVKPSAFELLSLARKLTARMLERRPVSVGFMSPQLDTTLAGRAAEAVVAALHAACFTPPHFKSKPAEKYKLAVLTLFGLKSKLDFSHTLAAAEGNALARWLTLLPANRLTPREYRGRLSVLARHEGWRFEFLNERRLRTLKAGAFLAVAQGSDSRDAGIAHLSYTPVKSARNQQTIALAGKGICYDTGGVNLKSAKSMFGMHGDMQGSAVALGTLLALTRIQAPFRVDCWLAIARNQIGPGSYTQNDVVTACNGVSIEVVHTDAEGRMVLADTLALASKAKPEFLMDYATLTGSCIVALGSRYSGAFCNRAKLLESVIEAGRTSGERVWPFPVDADYDEAIESDIADVKQCLIESEADHILAARMLSRFVQKDIPWIHLDLAAGEHKGGLAHIPTDVTGFGVRFSLQLLLERKAVKK